MKKKVQKLKSSLSQIKKPSFFVIGIALALIIYIFCFSPYPEFKEFKNHSYSTAVYDKSGYLLQVTTVGEGMRREWTDLNQIPKSARKIFIKAEDKRFYWHSGVDFFSIFKAAIQNVKAGRTVRGASTITMQLVKIIDADNWNNGDRPLTPSYARKIKDIFNALRLESRLTKNQILELYLNNVPFGLNTEGLTSAARSFFGKELQSLCDEEFLCLSVIPRRPSLYNPVINPEECAKRAGVPLEIAESAHLFSYPFLAPHYIEKLKNDDLLKKEKFVTSLDYELQNRAENYLRTSMKDAKGARISNGAVIVLDNNSGEILTWIGNNNWFDVENHGQVDAVLAKNQMGSSMKPFLYAMALDSQGNSKSKTLYTPATILSDIPMEFGGEKLYIPANFNNQFNGPVRFRISLASSLNIPAVALLDDLGVKNYLELLLNLGFDSLRYNGMDADLGLALGAGEVTLQELATAFAVFVRDGKTFDNKQIFTPDTARLICSILSDSGARALGFGYTQTFQTDYPSIFKTGTANQYQNIVAVGATKNYTVGVWMGNLEGQTVVGKTGSSLPAHVAKQILDLLEKNTPVSQLTFEEPENWEKQKICSLSGMKASKNCPAGIYEYVKRGQTPAECSWHQKKGGQTLIVYPGQYQSWILNYKINENINYNSIPLQIVTPKKNALFYYTQNNGERQTIKVEVTGGQENELSVIYDSRNYMILERPFIFNLPVERGHHSFTINCGGQELTQEFEVR